MIEARNVSVAYDMAEDRVNSIKEYLIARVKGKPVKKKFLALNDVSFSVNKGEVFGIIGHNGAGKSTLLKVISGILKPTGGSVRCQGNVVPMLELGSGFDYDLSGKENIYLNGAVLGYSKAFLQAHYQRIVDYSEIEPFINVPLRNYSSGMVMRLAFSIATVVEPEILIVDEILAVGDEQFQRKSRARMLELMKGGTTVLYVSHNMDQIREICDRVIWLEHGTMQGIGTADEICSKMAAAEK